MIQTVSDLEADEIIAPRRRSARSRTFTSTTSAGPIAGAVLPTAHPAPPEAMREAPSHIEEGDPHLRSCKELIGYGIEARDGSIGEVRDFVLDERSWTIRDVVVDTRVEG